MPILELIDLLQPAVLWSVEGVDDYGRQRIGKRQEILSRWEWGSHLIDNTTASSLGVVAVVYVDRVIEVQSILWQGSLQSLPSVPQNLMQVVDYKEIPDLKNRNIMRSAFISRWNGRLPVAT